MDRLSAPTSMVHPQSQGGQPNQGFQGNQAGQWQRPSRIQAELDSLTHLPGSARPVGNPPGRPIEATSGSSFHEHEPAQVQRILDFKNFSGQAGHSHGQNFASSSQGVGPIPGTRPVTTQQGAVVGSRDQTQWP